MDKNITASIIGTVISLGVFSAPNQANALVGMNFGTSNSTSPTNWTLVSQAGTFNNLIDENGNVTSLGVTVSGPAAGFSVATNSNTIPINTPSLSNLASNFYNPGFNATPLLVNFSGLASNSLYNIYVFGLRGGVPIYQTVTITGGGSPVSFIQQGPANSLFVNSGIGNSTNTLSSYAISILSSAAGTIDVSYTGGDGGNGVTFTAAGVAIDVPSAAVPFEFSSSLGILTFASMSGFLALRKKLSVR
ncbi:PFE-CTERM domain-containing protein [Trichormus variabilis]|uniref:PEP-CTERM protein-sorting domain-containing protein n=1 Tax=Trichormus variabilis SAG 1403-4b TaxID=447716 RepID=A0A3S1C2C1_ANAVA|nr:hypothetical protein [Trichormus variabilis]MBD2625741.1 hypothetical protein [Trichormus variabilis FACHB-164]RUS99027.1 hypothetical protein DSM107003_10460 [Trichormus variabilis SAG 1403-4b]